MKSAIISKRLLGRAISILIASLIFAGCTAPFASVHLKPFSETDSEIVGPQDSDIQEALTIIDSVLKNNGYVVEWSNGTGETVRGWWIVKTYIHKKPYIDATVFNQGVKVSNDGVMVGKRSVEVYVTFQEPVRWFLKIHPDVIRVQSEISQALIKRFGKEKVTTSAGRIEMPLQ